MRKPCSDMPAQGAALGIGSGIENITSATNILTWLADGGLAFACASGSWSGVDKPEAQAKGIRKYISFNALCLRFRLVASDFPVSRNRAHKPEAPAKLIVPPSAAPSRPVNFGEIWF